MCNEILDEAASSAATKWSGKVFSCQQCPGSRGSFQRRGTYFFCPGILSISRLQSIAPRVCTGSDLVGSYRGEEISAQLSEEDRQQMDTWGRITLWMRMMPS